MIGRAVWVFDPAANFTTVLLTRSATYTLLWLSAAAPSGFRLNTWCARGCTRNPQSLSLGHNTVADSADSGKSYYLEAEPVDLPALRRPSKAAGIAAAHGD